MHPILPSATAFSRREGSRVDLDRDLRLAQNVEMTLNGFRDADHILGRKRGRRPAAPVNVTHGNALRHNSGREFDFPDNGVDVARNRGIARDHPHVAPAIPAHLAAEWDMQIKRDFRAGIEPGQPGLIALGIHIRREMRRRGVTRVARNPCGEVLRNPRYHDWSFPVRIRCESPLRPAFCPCDFECARGSAGCLASDSPERKYCG